MFDSDQSNDVAIKLLRHLEWQAEGFSIVFFFADIGPADDVFSWLNDRLVISGTQLQAQKVDSKFAKDPESFVEDFISHLSEISQRSGGLWYELHRYPEDAQWNEARRRFLARLNERRFLLENKLRRPLVVVLPAEFRGDTRSIAPDIWHVRALSEELRARVIISSDEDVSSMFREEETVVLETPSYLEWQRIKKKGVGKDISLTTLFAAAKELIAAKKFLEAVKVAKEGVSIAFNRVRSLSEDSGVGEEGGASKTDTKTSSKTIKDSTQNPLQAANELFLSLLTLGDAFEALGKFDSAWESFSHALELIRKLNSESQNEFIRINFAVVLCKLGDFEARRGKLVEGERFLREGISVLKSIQAENANDDVVNRAIGTALLDLGNVLRRQGFFTEANSIYNENVLVRQNIAQTSTAAADRRQVAIGLANVGRTELIRGELSSAEKYLTESLDIFRSLEKERGSTSQSLRDLSITLRTLGQISQSRRDLEQADKRFGEALDISRQLVERDGRDSPALRDLLISTQDLGAVAMSLGDVDRARNLCQKSVEIAKIVGGQAGWTARTLGDIAQALRKLANVEKKFGNLIEAVKLLNESISISRKRVEKDGNSASASGELATLIAELAELKLEDDDLDAAKDLYREASEIQRVLLEQQRVPSYLRNYSRYLIELAGITFAQENYVECEAVSAEAIAVRRELLESSQNSPLLLRQLSVALNFFSLSLTKQDRYDEAREPCLEGLRIDRQLIETQGETISTLIDLRISLETLVIIDSHSASLDPLKSIYVEILEIGRKLVDLQPEIPAPLEELAQSLNQMATFLEETKGSAAEQLAILEEGIQVCEKLEALKKGEKNTFFDVEDALEKIKKLKKGSS